MLRNTVIVSILVIAPLLAFSQNYNTAVGIRAGLSNGLTIKHFMSQNKALEGILSTRWGGWNITGLYEVDKPIDVDGLTWFYGVGGHLGLYDADAANRSPWFNSRTESVTIIGVDAIIGLEFTIPNAPINFQLDYKPGFNLVGNNSYWGDEGALSVRFTF